MDRIRRRLQLCACGSGANGISLHEQIHVCAVLASMMENQEPTLPLLGRFDCASDILAATIPALEDGHINCAFSTYMS